jgi:pimeloyl-ACP methyl ester carboxylesterase
MAGSDIPDAGRSIFVAAQDGLRLHVREYGDRALTRRLPVVCLPGLARTVADFEELSPALSSSRFVIALESRGRGQSDCDPNPANYNVATELADLVHVLATLDVGPAIFVGSSRGGILTMLMAAAHPTAVAAAVLHDIGPVIEAEGVARIKSYIGKLPQPHSLEEGSEILRRLFAAQFPSLTATQWLGAARRTWRVSNGELTLSYDPNLMHALADFEVERPLPPLWDEFDALSRVPLLVIRGANSDILSTQTVAAMYTHHPKMELIEVPNQGHVPLLESDLIGRIIDFVRRCDEFAAGTSAAKNGSFVESPALAPKK